MNDLATLAKRQLATFKRQGQTESVIYRPGTGRTRVISVIVDREGLRVEGHVARPVMRVMAINDQIDGIDPKLIDKGADHIDVAQKFGGPAIERAVGQIVEQDEGWVTVEVA